NKVIYLVLSIIFVSVLLIATQVYFDEIREERFYSRTEEDYADCFQKAQQDNVETRWCREIKSASIQTYNSAKASNDSGI
ncbi:hypothetical protein, partial [Escherichia coli]|uniref:hypothetical protein n=1 Tax=Escherichia coli TaxID=562 RepID=UPI0015547727